MSCRVRLYTLTIGPDWGKLNGLYRARPMVCQPSPNMTWLMLWAGPGLLPVVLGQMVWAKFSGLL
jgi:hypothetical protein